MPSSCRTVKILRTKVGGQGTPSARYNPDSCSTASGQAEPSSGRASSSAMLPPVSTFEAHTLSASGFSANRNQL